MRASQPAEDKAPSRSEDAESLACGRGSGGDPAAGSALTCAAARLGPGSVLSAAQWQYLWVTKHAVPICGGAV